jgi:hypothetical protein
MQELNLKTQCAQVEVVNDRVAVMASYAPTPRVTRSVEEFITQLADAGYQVLLVRASEDPSPLKWHASPPPPAIVLRRPNIGYDFGSWAAVLNTLPKLRRAGRVLLVNDSLVGPFGPIAPLLEHFESSMADAWGAVTNPQVMSHLQSFFLGFHGGILDDPPLREFWRSIRPQVERMDYVMKYELGLNRALWSESYATQSANPYGSLGLPKVNPTLDQWQELLVRGFPFVKRALLTDPEGASRSSKIAETVKAMYGVEIEEWI